MFIGLFFCELPFYVLSNILKCVLKFFWIDHEKATPPQLSCGGEALLFLVLKDALHKGLSHKVEMLWNNTEAAVVQHCECIRPTASFILKWLVLRHVNFILINSFLKRCCMLTLD
jgi:hypothetical protein